MPSVPSNSKCASLGCKNNKARLSSYCVEHGGIDTYVSKASKERNAFNSMYQTAFWKQLRIIQLSRQPLCQCCLTRGIITPAKHVDHVFPWNRIGKHAFKRNIFQSLCHECHSHKTSLEARGIFKHYDDTERDYTAHDYEYIVAMHQR